MSIANIEQNILIVNYTTKKITSKQIELEAIRKKMQVQCIGAYIKWIEDGAAR